MGKDDTGRIADAEHLCKSLSSLEHEAGGFESPPVPPLPGATPIESRACSTAW